MIEQLIQRRFSGSARKKHVIDENNRRAIHVRGNVRGGKLLGDGILPDIIAVERNIQRAGSRLGPLRQPPGEFDATIRNPDEDQFLACRMPGGNGIRQPLDRGMYLLRADGLGRGHRPRL
jgi:hypothetical protein